ncbi:phosphate ABC transporter substrate-binding protein PstS [Streptomyces sp. ISL-1]|uniref:phosphate ABC transporter substrate-binding protein PstS n=1 Tax=Streptomyces sp. ISL-1 TaxID=2817657 RepID=UPI0027E54202|nr:phosphate ABC transporter substrate-binding protein PstS [Streptomyces sp. ISL-1]
MQRRPTKGRIALAAAAALTSMLLTACDTDSSPAGEASAADPAAAKIECATQGQLPGSGSTAQQNAMEYWIKQYQRACTGVQIRYNPLGSGAGVAQFLRGATGFGGSDGALKPEEVQWSKDVCAGGRAIDLPMVGGPIAIGFNLQGVDDLVLDAPTLAKIFDSRITSWNHPDIRRLNPGAKLPSVPVHPVHRSDDSGTTQNLNAYLAGAAGGSWPHPVKKSWEGKGGEAASGSIGVASQVQSLDGSIGYFELSFAAAGKISTVKIDTGASRPVAPTPRTASAGMAEAEIAGTGKDLTLEFDYATSAEGAYPIVQVTYEIVCDTGNRAETLPALKSFLAYTAGEEGQKALPGIHYAPLPDSVAGQVRQVVQTLS